MGRQQAGEFAALVEASFHQPLAAQRYGKDAVYTGIVQPGRRQGGHQFRQQTLQGYLPQVFEFVQQAADGRFVMQRRP